MAGTLTISTLSDGTNSTSSTNCIQGSAKAWINFNGTGTPAVRASYNVSSITDNGTGDYTINFTNALADTNYAVNYSCSYAGSGSGPMTQTDTYTTSSIRIKVSTTVAFIDPTFNNVSVFR